jgi:hypothetical protein
MKIVNLFFELARQHKRIKGFFYGKAYEKGAGNEAYPLVWLDDPVYGQSVVQTLTYSCNVDILGIPKNETDVPRIQTEAFEVGLSFAEKIKQIYRITGFGVRDFSFISLRDYYDNGAAGFRFTYTLAQANPVNRCNGDFDPSKHFPTPEALPDFKVDAPDGCAIFNEKSGLPDFKIK